MTDDPPAPDNLGYPGTWVRLCGGTLDLEAIRTAAQAAGDGPPLVDVDLVNKLESVGDGLRDAAYFVHMALHNGVPVTDAERDYLADRAHAWTSARQGYVDADPTGEPWLHGWVRQGRTVMVGNSDRCAGCGAILGVVTIAITDMTPEARPEPTWPFDTATCPVPHHEPVAEPPPWPAGKRRPLP